jgi:simple sugar transport system substrate-binding protein
MQYVLENVPGTSLTYQENINAGNADVPFDAAIQNLLADGAQLIITASDEFEEDTARAAEEYPDVTFINVSGDDAYTGEAPANLGNVMGQMEWGKMIAGCAAALTTETGSIGYLGPLINFETRRLVASAYLGAKYCWENYRGGDPVDLTFTVTWIGFWFYIPEFTLDPTVETNTFYDNGADVVISGIDTPVAVTVAGQRFAADERVFAVPYDYEGACEGAPAACLGVPYFRWGPSYKRIVEAVMAGTYEQSWEYDGPDWEDINNPDTSAVGFVAGEGLSEEASASLDAFIAEMAAFAPDPANEGTFGLFEGPLNYQDGTPLAAEGETLPMIAPLGEAESVWYLQQLLEGMVGLSE